MELVTKKRLELFSGRSHLPLAEEIAGHMGTALGDPHLQQFANGELKCRFGDSIRGADVFIVQSHAEPVNEAIMEQLIMIDAAKRASAKRITAVCPYYGYGRQDRKAEGREPITAKLLTDLLSAAGADRILSVDLHTGQIQGFFDGPFDHLPAMPVLEQHLREHLGADFISCAPDPGRIKVADRYAEHFETGLAVVGKRHLKGEINKVEAFGVMGEVQGRACVLVDDMIDTAGTMCAAADRLREAGASEIWAVATHGILSDPAIDRLKNSAIDKIVVTNTLPLPPEKQIDKIEVVSVAGLIADAINAVFAETSVSELAGGENQI